MKTALLKEEGVHRLDRLAKINSTDFSVFSVGFCEAHKKAVQNVVEMWKMKNNFALSKKRN